MNQRTSDVFGESYFRTLVQSMPFAVTAIDSVGRLRFVNAAFCQLVGRDESELIDRLPPYPHWPPEENAALQQRMSRLLQGHFEPDGFVTSFCHRNGERFQVRVRVQPIDDKTGAFSGWLATIDDLRTLAAAQERLRERERFIETVAQAVPEIIYVYDIRANRNVYVNRHIAEMLGYAPEAIQALGSDFLPRLAHPDDVRRLPELLARWNTVGDGEIVETTYRMRSVRGDYRWFSARDTVFQRDGSGAVVQIIGAAQDITERKRIEDSRDDALQHLGESEWRYRLLADNSTDLITLLEPSGVYRYASPACARLLGYAPNELIGRSCYEFVQPDDRDIVFHFHGEIARDRIVLSTTYRVRRKDGEIIWFETRAQPIVDLNSNQIVEIIAVSRDVSDRVTAADALRRSEELFRALVERSSDGIAMIGPDLRVRYLSPSAAHIIGFSPAAAQDALAKDFIIPEDYLAWKEEAREPLREPGGSFAGRVRARRKGGAIRHLEVVVTNHLTDPNIGSYVVNFRDVTDRQELEDQLRQAQKMEAVGRLAGGIAHDFNNILTAIIGNVALLHEATDPNDPSSSTLSAIDKAARRAAELTRRLLGYSRRTALRLEPIAVNRVVDEVLSMLRPTIDRRIDFVPGLDSDVWPALADPGQISQVLVNLILNARDAMPDGGTIVVTTANARLEGDVAARDGSIHRGEFVQIAVADTGCGMTSEVQSHLFEPFFTTKPTGMGTGLGLPMVYGIMKSHGGWVECSSELGSGTRIDLYLPRSVTPVAEPSVVTPESSRSTSAGKTILLVDDEPMIRALGRHILEQDGYEVLLAEDGVEAIAKIGRLGASISLVILDMTMPRMSGLDTFRRMRELCPQLRVLFSSGYSVDVLGDLDATVGFINKPYRPAELLDAVRNHLPFQRSPPETIDEQAPPSL